MRSDSQIKGSHVWVLWVVAISFALHATEEYFTGWQSWALQISGIVVPTSLFITANVVAVVAAFAVACNGWKWPAVSLIFPAATLVNGIFFHILPTIAMRRTSPGVYTSSLLYLPFSSYAFFVAWRNRVSRKSMALAFLLGFALNCAVVLGVWFMSDTSMRTAL
ncbi:MAG TPA: HXXEE domain-containing protein [Pyrinomonadaceae bacterium]|jgi:hypothetical protein